ncbi:MAG TPA: DHHA1 domain-containing protein [Candidatus Paceibacterota bacterium]|nr:DHHA1 domain-containing protein [Candidatus Paceibacterota bacterium]
MKSIVVIYHANCPDGFGAAYAAWKKFGNRADYFAVKPHQLPPNSLRNKEVYILDGSYPAQLIKELKRTSKRVVIIDHHISNKKEIKYASDYLFDLNHSGAYLAWQYFHPKKKVPKLLRYIEEGDLWKFKSPQIHTLLAYIYSLPYDFKVWDNICRRMEKLSEKKKYIALGKVISDYDARIVKAIAEKAELVKFGKYKILAVNFPLRKYTSEVAHKLYRRRPPIGIVWHVSPDGIKVSLRSNGKVNVAKIAEKYGGGGHRAASSFILPRNAKLPWKVINVKKIKK